MTIKKTYLPHSGAAGPILFWVATFKCTVISSINGIFSPGWFHSWGWDTVTIPLVAREVFHTFVTSCTLKNIIVLHFWWSDKWFKCFYFELNSCNISKKCSYLFADKSKPFGISILMERIVIYHQLLVIFINLVSWSFV